jgi:C-terminal processing protease CtpA/Prc
MKKILTVFALLLSTEVAFGQLARDQKLFDFQSLAALFVKQYGPYEWKRDALHFDLFDLKPWLDRVERSKDDLEFYEICAQYVASLDDLHSQYFVPSMFEAYIGIGVDLYDDKPLIDSIDRRELPEEDFPFQIGDELISVDGQLVEDWIRDVSRLVSFANPRSTRRFALDQIFDRYQFTLPRAHEIGEEATVVIRRQSGEMQTYMIPWNKAGDPVTTVGPVPSPRLRSAPRKLSTHAAEQDWPSYMQALLKLRNRRVPRQLHLRGFGRLAPVFNMPESFRQRLGRRAGDFFFSGTYEAEGRTIGFLRIPDFLGDESLFTELAALDEFETEIAFFSDNADGLVLDIMRNPGGDFCYAEELLQRLIPYRFRTIGDEVRPTLEWLQGLQSALADAKAQEAEQWVIDLLGFILEQMTTAYTENRGLTGPLPLCTPLLDLEPATDSSGNVIAFNKPLLLLIDEFSTSSGDAFAAVMQDSLRAPLLGLRTAGGGGVVEGFQVGYYSEGWVSLSRTVGVRKMPVVTSEYPTAPLIENIGVRPDIYVDYMTRENLLSNGKPFVETFTKAMLDTIEGR